MTVAGTVEEKEQFRGNKRGMMISATAEVQSSTWMSMEEYGDKDKRAAARARVVGSLVDNMRQLAAGTNGCLAIMQEEMANLKLVDPTLNAKETRRVVLAGSRASLRGSEIEAGQEQLLRDAEAGGHERVVLREARAAERDEFEVEEVPGERPERPVNGPGPAFVAMCAKCNKVYTEDTPGKDLVVTCSGPCKSTFCAACAKEAGAVIAEAMERSASSSSASSLPTIPAVWACHTCQKMGM